MEQSAAAIRVQSRSVSEVREHVIETFNQAVRRPGMFHGDRALGVYLEMLAYLDGDDDGFVWIVDSNQRTVDAPIQELFPGAAVAVEASLNGEEAFRRGWLRLSRELSDVEYSSLIDRIPKWQAGAHLASEVLLTHGPASVVFGPTNPAYPTTIAYATADPATPMVLFYFGHRSRPAESKPAARVTLLAIRVADGEFPGGRLFPCQGTATASGDRSDKEHR